MTVLPLDYEERVYAGVLGKIIGVYLGRPFEGWLNKDIERVLGEVNYFVHEKLNAPLIVSDDDISGTFTFLRALPDNGNSPDLNAAQIGRTWMNYLIENRTVLWWGGMGHSTEHTAYLRMKGGMEAPESGSMETNGKVVAEQIGAQIFIDGWAMVSPGDPDKAAEFARRAASVSHDGEAIYGAQIIAAMEALAFIETDLNKIIATAQTFIPRASVIYQLIDDMRAWHHADRVNWRATLRKIEAKYGYVTYGGNCHMVPNHAVILLGLLYGEDDFQKSLMITNTAGWDTDCNSGNVGCFLGIKNGLAGMDKGPDWRGPVADRMYLPSADGGRCVTDAAREAYQIINIGRSLRGLRPLLPDGGVRFHFEFPGSVQGFRVEDSVESRGTVRLENCPVTRTEENRAIDKRTIAIHYSGVAPGRPARIATPTFVAQEDVKKGRLKVGACPTLYSGQTVRARLHAEPTNPKPAPVTLYINVFDKDDNFVKIYGTSYTYAAGEGHTLTWLIPDTDGRPIGEIGVEISGSLGAGTVAMDWMNWTGAPTVNLCQPAEKGDAWRYAWVNAVDHFEIIRGSEDRCYRLIQDSGTGQLIQGEAQWHDYVVTVDAEPHMADYFGVMVNVTGLRRHVALVIGKDGMARLIEESDGVEIALSEAPIEWELDKVYHISVTSRRDGLITASVNGDAVLLTGVVDSAWAQGAVGLLVSEGHAVFGPVRIEPAEIVIIG